jgi:predicted glycoside hydrolase/deacetylase ChbG (UPF0249 family)
MSTPTRRSFSPSGWFCSRKRLLLIQLVVNGDDFGFTHDVNDGIVEAHLSGILTATTLMANGNAFDHAVALAKRTPTLDVGCHLVMVQGTSVANQGRPLPATLPELTKTLAGSGLNPYAEARAQLQKIIDAGITPSHIDTHKHTHLFPPVMDALVRAAREFGIPWVRRPFDFGAWPGAKLSKQAIMLGMRLLKPSFANKLEGFRYTDHFTGFLVTGSLDVRALLSTLEKLPEGSTELMCHPGRLTPELEAAPTRLKQSRADELAALTSPAAKELIAKRGIRLASFRDL